jgi:excisionase family DNA binding protein
MGERRSATGRVNERPGIAIPLERYVDARELAELMGVSTSTVKRMVAAGMPSETWGMSRTRRFRPSDAMAWARDRDRGKMRQPRDRDHTAPGQQKE